MMGDFGAFCHFNYAVGPSPVGDLLAYGIMAAYSAYGLCRLFFKQEHDDSCASRGVGSLDGENLMTFCGKIRNIEYIDGEGDGR